jgi:hypothetical protein
MLPSTRQNGVGIATVADFGAESSRPASLLCTLRTHQSPGEWQHSLPACSLALAGRDSHPLDFIKWFPLLHYWFLHFHVYPSAICRCLTIRTMLRLSGRTVARNRASNDAAVSTVPPIIPYGGFSPVRLEGWHLQAIGQRLPPGRVG